MKIHPQTKRGLNTLKFGGYSEILTLFLRGNGNPGRSCWHKLRSLSAVSLAPKFQIFFLF